jgi:acyl-coenzyme A thioesterase PaaI-like protein
LGASDAALLAFATTDGRVLITADPDHLRLHAAGVPHAGILFAPPDAAIGLLIGGAMLIAEVLTANEMVNRVEFLSATQARTHPAAVGDMLETDGGSLAL